MLLLLNFFLLHGWHPLKSISNEQWDWSLQAGWRLFIRYEIIGIYFNELKWRNFFSVFWKKKLFFWLEKFFEIFFLWINHWASLKKWGKKSSSPQIQNIFIFYTCYILITSLISSFHSLIQYIMYTYKIWSRYLKK